MKVSATLKGKKDSLGRKPVVIRIADGKKRSYRSTNIRVVKTDFEKGKVKSSHPQARELNNKIKGLVLDTEMGLMNNRPKDIDFFTYCTDCFNGWDKTKRDSTLRQHWSEVSKLKGFTQFVKLSQINPEWLQAYSDYCYNKLGNKENTVWKTFKFIRVMIRNAMRAKLIASDPFTVFKMPKYQDPEKVFLSKEQVNKIDKYCADKKCPQELCFIGTWFVISCTTGLRFSDCKNFDKKQIKSGRLIVYTLKTRQPVSFPFNEKLKKLFEHINYRPLNLTNEYVNRMLKVICEANDVEQISFHCARHTFGTLAASAGIRREAIAALMGHKDLRSTAIYAKLTAPTLDKELSKMR